MVMPAVHEPPVVSSTPFDDLADAFVTSLATKDVDALGRLLTKDLRFRMILPSGPTAVVGASAALARIASWFADADPIEIETANSNEIVGRMVLTYRFRVRRTGGWHLIEQHLMLDVSDGRISGIDLLCSGFRPITDDDPSQIHQFDAGDLGCADGLAGEFRRQMQLIAVGDVLEVTARDPAAKEDLPSLARLMGHNVRSIEASGDGRLLVSVERGR